MLSILAQQSQPAGGIAGLIIPIVLMIGVFYFLLIRPQQKRMRAQRELMSDLGVDDEVLTIGGIYGTIKQVDDDNDEMILEIAPGTTIRITRQAVARKVTEDEEDEYVDDEDDDADGDGMDDAAENEDA